MKSLIACLILLASSNVFAAAKCYDLAISAATEMYNYRHDAIPVGAQICKNVAKPGSAEAKLICSINDKNYIVVLTPEYRGFAGVSTSCTSVDLIVDAAKAHHHHRAQ